MENQTANAITLREPMQLTSENVEAVFKDCLTESDGIAIGDTVRLKNGFVRTVSAIVDYGTHIVFFLDLGGLIKYPARREWIELIKKANDNEND